MEIEKVANTLNTYYEKYNTLDFIADDPIAIPHSFTKKQDIEISGFFAAIFSWGQRTTIVKKSRELMSLMDNSPYQFITQHKDADLKPLLHFKHRTFNDTDLLYFIQFLKIHYLKNKSLESAFIHGATMRERLIHFQKYFINQNDFPTRTQKHISSPAHKSACKRLNMYLRWMVRKDKHGVDFGIWKQLQSSELQIPLDVHVLKVALRLGLTQSEKSDWTNVEKITEQLRIFDSADPVKYDFALFGMGILDKKIFTHARA